MAILVFKEICCMYKRIKQEENCQNIFQFSIWLIKIYPPSSKND